ncbi:MAG: DUF6262 family protein [Lachnospiraceae bacterium]|nr:DUF6262 family protein [Lachnospiraceae bacterium]
MNKYDKMIEENKKRSAEKVAVSRAAIRELQESREYISVPKLMKMTGLSRGFFYKNLTIRKEMDRAIEQQAGLVDPRREIIDKAMDNQIELLQQKVAEQRYEIEQLKKKNEKLQKALNKKDLGFIKNL